MLVTSDGSLTAGDPVTVGVDITVDADAHGSGSTAIAAYSEGMSNHIEPLLLSAAPLP